jgi:hypothetical protein
MSSFGPCEFGAHVDEGIWIADLSVRQFVTLNLLRPFASWLGLKKAKLFRFLERESNEAWWEHTDEAEGYAVFYFGIMGTVGVVSSSLPVSVIPTNV